MLGGAMYALERGLHMKWLGIIFAALASLAAFGIGCGVQVNAVANVINANLSPVLTKGSGIFSNCLSWMVLLR